MTDDRTPLKRRKNGVLRGGVSSDVGEATRFGTGNPGGPGRPKEKLITDALRKYGALKVKEFFTTDELAKFKFERFAENMVVELAANRAWRMVIAGNSDGARILREILDRLEGRVPLPLMGVEGGEFVLNMVNHIARPDRSAKPSKPVKAPKKNLQ